MYEVGKKRLDGKYNVWNRVQIANNYWDWVIVSVCDSFNEALEFASAKNRKPKPHYKVNQ